MNRVALTILATAALTITAAAAVEAGPIRHRQGHQQARIHQGVDSGALTAGEAKALSREQRAINHARTRLLADGSMSPVEAKRLTRAQDRASRHIYRLKHNKRVASGQ